jgi:hypothetical protein
MMQDIFILELLYLLSQISKHPNILLCTYFIHPILTLIYIP